LCFKPFSQENEQGSVVEMTEENKTPEMGETEQPTQTPAEMVSISAAELAEIRAALKKANGEAAKYRKTAEQVEQERKAKDEAEMTAVQKAERRAAELEAELSAVKRAQMQAAAAAKLGLPAALADRLKGDTADELEADAKVILETLPKPAPPAPKSPGINPLNPGGNGSPGETREQKRTRLTGNPIDPFSSGSGVFWGEKPEG
jgi:hypothetical protein